MSLLSITQTNERYNAFVLKLEAGRDSLGAMSAFLNDPDLDNDTRIFFKAQILAVMPTFVSAYQDLMLTLTTPYVPPPPPEEPSTPPPPENP